MKKKERHYRNLRLIMDVYDILRKLAKNNQTSMTGIVRFLITEVELGRIKLDWGKVREAYPDTRVRVQQQWKLVEDNMAIIMSPPGLKTGKIRLDWLINKGEKRGLSEKQVLRWLQNQFDDRVLGRGTSPTLGEYYYVL